MDIREALEDIEQPDDFSNRQKHELSLLISFTVVDSLVEVGLAAPEEER